MGLITKCYLSVKSALIMNFQQNILIVLPSMNIIQLSNETCEKRSWTIDSDLSKYQRAETRHHSCFWNRGAQQETCNRQARLEEASDMVEHFLSNFGCKHPVIPTSPISPMPKWKKRSPKVLVIQLIAQSVQLCYESQDYNQDATFLHLYFQS